MKTTKTRSWCVLVAACLGLVFLLIVSSGICPRQQTPWTVTFLKFSKGQRMEFYYRDFNQPIAGGRFFWALQAKLKAHGYPKSFVEVRHKTLFEDPHRVCVVLGMDGPLPRYEELGAVLLVGEERVPLRCGRVTVTGTEHHIVFCESAPMEVLPEHGVFLLTNSTSGATLLARRL